MPAPFKWTKEQIQDLRTSYEQGESLKKIAQRYGTSHQVLSSLLKRHGLILKAHYEAVRTHTCDYGYFHMIDTEEKAYWLGFLTADGNVTTGNRVGVNLASVDCEHLYKLKNALKATQMMSKSRDSCSLIICSPEMAVDLAQHGIQPRKTLSTKPARVASELERHYWKGVIDGDGYISKDRKQLLLVEDYEMVTGFQSFVLAHCSRVKASIFRKVNIYTFKVTGMAAMQVLEILYKGAMVYLDRKYERAFPQALR